MGEPAFTPGPWVEMPTDASVDDNYNSEDDGQRINTWVGIGNPELTDGMVAIAVFDMSIVDDPEFNANIALLAAAPTMFEALEMIEAGHGCPSAVARNALAKVRGEANA